MIARQTDIPNSLLVVSFWQPSVSNQAVIFDEEFLERIMDRESLLPNPNDLQHAEVFELVQDEFAVVVVGRLLHVGLDAPDVPGVGRLEHIDEHLKLESERVADGRLGLVGHHPLHGAFGEASVALVDVGAELGDLG